MKKFILAKYLKWIFKKQFRKSAQNRNYERICNCLFISVKNQKILVPRNILVNLGTTQHKFAAKEKNKYAA